MQRREGVAIAGVLVVEMAQAGADWPVASKSMRPAWAGALRVAMKTKALANRNFFMGDP